jgi:hypothetical protein
VGPSMADTVGRNILGRCCDAPAEWSGQHAMLGLAP